jgi:hypothetical protein
MVRFTVLVVLLALATSSQAQTRGTFSGDAVSGLGIGGQTAKEDVPEQPPTLETIDQWLGARTAALTLRLRAAKAGRLSREYGAHGGVAWIEKSRRYGFADRASRDKEVSRLQEELKSPTLPPLNPFALAVGQIGSLADPFSRTGLGDARTHAEQSTTFAVAQILDDQSAVIFATRYRATAKFLLVSAIIAGYQEDQTRGGFPGAFIVDRRQQADTVSGAASMLPVVRTYDLTPHLEKLAPVRVNPQPTTSPASKSR